MAEATRAVFPSDLHVGSNPLLEDLFSNRETHRAVLPGHPHGPRAVQLDGARRLNTGSWAERSGRLPVVLAEPPAPPQLGHLDSGHIVG